MTSRPLKGHVSGSKPCFEHSGQNSAIFEKIIIWWRPSASTIERRSSHRASPLAWWSSLEMPLPSSGFPNGSLVIATSNFILRKRDETEPWWTLYFISYLISQLNCTTFPMFPLNQTDLQFPLLQLLVRQRHTKTRKHHLWSIVVRSVLTEPGHPHENRDPGVDANCLITLVASTNRNPNRNPISRPCWSRECLESPLSRVISSKYHKISGFINHTYTIIVYSRIYSM